MDNNIVPSNIKEYLKYRSNKKINNISITIIDNKFVFNSNKKSELDLNPINILPKNIKTIYMGEGFLDFSYIRSSLDIDRIYIGILYSNNVKKIVYYGYYQSFKHAEYIHNGEKYIFITEVLFKNNKKFKFNGKDKLYEIFIDVYKKYGIKNENWEETIKECNKKYNKYKFYFKNLNDITFSNNNSLNKKYCNNINTNNLKIIKFITPSMINNKGIRSIICNNNNNNNNNCSEKIKKNIFYFGHIKYKYKEYEIFDKLICLGNFIKKSSTILFFDNIIIDLSYEEYENNIEKFILYEIIN